MHIICVSHWRVPAEKTMTPYMMRVAEAFAREGHEVEFWVPNRKNSKFLNVDPFEYHDIQKIFTLRRLPVIDIMEFMPGRVSFFIMLLSFTVSLLFQRFGKRNQRHICYFFDLRDAWSVLLFSRNVYSEIHMYYRSSVTFLNRWGFPRCRGVIAATKVMQNDICTLYNVPRDRVIHAPCAVNSERFAINTPQAEARKKIGLPLEKKIILYVGHLFPVKGVDVLFDVHRLLAKDCVLYFVGGTDEDIARFRATWDLAGKPSNIVIVGRKPHREIPLWLRAADILSIPNTAKDPAGSVESSPSKLIEYMASGRPIIASDVPGIRDVMDDTMGYFVAPDSPEAIAAAIRDVLNDAAGAAGRAAAAREAARGLSWEARAKKILAFMQI